MPQPALPDLLANPVLDTAVVGRLRALERQAGAAPGALLGELTRVFVSDARARASALRDAVEARAPKEVSRLAHALRGAAANMGASRLAALAAHVEERGEAETDLVDALARAVDDADVALREALLAPKGAEI